MAIRDDGTLVGWGNKDDGITDVPTGTFTQVAAGSHFCIGLQTDGTLVGWGRGGGAKPPSGEFKAVSACAMFGLGLRTDGTVVGWGYSQSGKPYPGTYTAIAAISPNPCGLTTENEIVPFRTGAALPDLPLGKFTTIGPGRLAIRNDGTLATWRPGWKDLPVGTFIAVASGRDHGVAIRSDGTLVAWGDNKYGQTDVPAGNYCYVAAGGHVNVAIATSRPSTQPKDVSQSGGTSVAQPKENPPTPDSSVTQPNTRRAIPDEASREKVLAIIRDAYKNEYKSPDRAAFVKKFLQTADETKNDPVARFVLLQEAKDVATEVGQGELAFQAIDAIVAEYKVSGTEMKAEVIEKGVKMARLVPQKIAIAKAALQVMDEAVAEDNFDVARQLGKQALQLARLGKEGSFVQDIVAKNKAVEAAAKAYADVQEAMATLKERPTDPDANLVVGKYYCFMQDQWNTGLPLLGLGKDAALKALAERDMKGATTAEERVKLGDAWWDGGGKQRAVHWYEEALPQLTSLERDRVEARVASLAGATRNTKWFLVFRSSDPKIWNSPKPIKNKTDYAVPLSMVSDEIKYLKLSCGKESVIIPITKATLGTFTPTSGTMKITWNGNNLYNWNACHLGIMNHAMQVGDPDGEGKGRIVIDERQILNVPSGWGFGRRTGLRDQQGYVWAGQAIPPSVFTVEVTTGELTPQEQQFFHK